MDGMNKEKWQAMDKKKKAQYVWDYYKWPILIVIVILIVAVDMIYISITKKDPVMTVAMFNMVPENPNSTDSDFGEFLDTYGYENFDGAVSNYNSFYIYEESENPELHDKYYFAHGENLINMLYAQAIDVVFGRGQYFEILADGKAFMDLRTLLSAETLEKFADSLVYCDPVPPEGYEPEEGEEVFEPYPCAIMLKDNAWVKENGCYMTGCFIAVPMQSEVKQVTLDFLEYILALETIPAH